RRSALRFPNLDGPTATGHRACRQGHRRRGARSGPEVFQGNVRPVDAARACRTLAPYNDRVLHLLNGDATAAVFPDTLPGERAVWRDILMEGPAEADADTRAAWLAPRLGVSADAYARRWREEIAMLSAAKEHDEVVLWFERDLFCSLNLWFVLTRLDVPRVSLVFPTLDGDFRGLGTLRPGDFPPLFERREHLTLDDLRDP